MKPLGDTLLIATHNAGKLEEFSAMLAPLGIACRSNADYDLPEPEETEETFVGNARIKARAAVTATGLPALADDSGLEVDALDGQPGVHTADWAETGQGRDFGQAMERAHAALVAKGAPQPWTARFRATLVLLWPDGTEAVFEGTAPGHLVWPIRGQTGHGYDPMFVPDGHDRTFAEMPLEEKNAISHRADALAQLKAALERLA
ncbi:RdgB/HAM1 family non-canonical purine NTP pyrophosphatase [Jannaschia formosa]|uniref:RdgB/HAM1 family non-canonical purine NTP pyrophosphatase n=1 Tax=Jannaschia formosa TaxID=2259592 RepID=UPI000E1B7D05|nr:RdgB/HAM1 family non-canonical purine NTP pyrophosphatase [Jannaschia formosa]TFL17560.1 RdgB/HAM1 family non-canonical purine NTP pyrophosphatase [Jannaschia formosa]